MSEEIRELRERVKSLEDRQRSFEDWQQGIIRAMVAAPEPSKDQAKSWQRDFSERYVEKVKGEEAPKKVPSVEEKELLEHKGWKGKKKEEGGHYEGSLNFGWDFQGNFSKETIEYLHKHTLTPVGESIFSVNDAYKTVNVKKAKS